MILSDFNLSTSSLNGELVIWATDQTAPRPINELLYHHTQLILTNTKSAPVLTLDQFRTRVQTLPPQTQFFLVSVDYPLFGYRLDGGRLIFG